jgi:hypothetical protein
VGYERWREQSSRGNGELEWSEEWGLGDGLRTEADADGEGKRDHRSRHDAATQGRGRAARCWTVGEQAQSGGTGSKGGVGEEKQE